MKALLAAWMTSAGAVAAADVQVTVHVAAMPQAKLAELMAAGGSGDELFAKVRAELGAHTAELIDTSVARVRSGQRCTIQSIGEVMRPTEYEPVQLTCTPRQPPEHPGFLLPACFTSADVTQTGFTFTIEPSVAPGWIDLQANWQWIAQAEDFDYHTWRDEFGQASHLILGHFTRLETPTAVSLATGKWTLLATLPSKSKDGAVDLSRRVAIFVKADRLEP